MKKLQVALDVANTAKAEEILEQIAEYVDIIELGTPLMIAEGVRVIKAIKTRYPEKTVFADIKIMDGGAIMAKEVFEAGADMVSVLAAANDATIKDVIETAKEYKGQVLVDMCAIQELAQRAKVVEAWKPDYICVHVGYDVQNTGADPVEEIKKLKEVKISKAAAGGIKLGSFEAACQSDIDDIIVGGGLYNVENPRDTAMQMYNLLNEYR
ncbi:MAG: orotidine 5'-phosphate decarboxylase [Streptococcaceae bacterium]|jgi:3-hexulose-6-phosphate synthase|nr:orotidine 5'-phosphate decarboxylase [Streptococcaceae bacterium]